MGRREPGASLFDTLARFHHDLGASLTLRDELLEAGLPVGRRAVFWGNAQVWAQCPKWICYLIVK